jgi:hypothetical protein
MPNKSELRLLFGENVQIAKRSAAVAAQAVAPDDALLNQNDARLGRMSAESCSSKRFSG